MQRIRTDRRRLILDFLPLLVMVLLILVDQITKTYCKNLYENHGWETTTVIDGFFNFTYAVNTGAAWSFLADKAWSQTFFKVLTGVALVGFYFFYVFSCKKDYKFLRYALVLIIAGTIGNYIDRLAYNGVVDFISFIFGTYHFPIFNLADSYMTIGIIMMIVHFLFLDDNKIFGKHDKKTVSNSK